MAEMENSLSNPGHGLAPKTPVTPVVTAYHETTSVLTKILLSAGEMAAQWPEEIFLQLRIAAIWSRLGQPRQAVDYLRTLTRHYQRNDCHLTRSDIDWHCEMMRYFLAYDGIDDSQLFENDMRRHLNFLCFWKKPSSHAGPVRTIEMGTDRTMLTTLYEEDEAAIRNIASPRTNWWQETAHMTQLPVDANPMLVQELCAIHASADADTVAGEIMTLLKHCHGWHERVSDMPIWVHDLDDVGVWVICMAITIQRADLIINYLDRCIETLNENALALIPHMATAIAGLGYYSKRYHRNDLLRRALDLLPLMPEYESCVSAITLLEVLVEQS